MIAYKSTSMLMFKVREWGETFHYRVYYHNKFMCVIGENAIGNRWTVREHARATPDIIQGIYLRLASSSKYYNLGRENYGNKKQSGCGRK